ncbi:tRNA-uridine aminocarboxypropyltransferase [Psychromonas algicola]|uniref:tRNA-uridine aminocarboxypropyltransferase n=1 Tax=Psychromonas algicola TaxID=2555642 RepID=UPI001067F1D6|nr:tRNA-uridine aminocarboxypropyltransferase [Psychromonas sp. RZ5]TEW46005.1 DTW domain-containing protein [Psychromonas sp. RZ5]
MSKRPFCQQCNKALSACICGFIQPLENQYFLYVLQDPSEQNKAIGTARILGLSLSQVKVTVGDHFNQSDFDLDNTFLVFPDEQAESIDELRSKQKINRGSQFIILDGSWKKAYKLLMSNPFLQALPKVMINVSDKSEYRIRKSPREDGLSTVEAGYYLLSELENNNDKFLPLLDVFNKMIDFQIKRMPADIYNKNYLNKQQSSLSATDEEKK